MTVEPTLSLSKKVQMGLFAAEIRVKYPQHKSDIEALTKTLEDKKAFPPEVRAKMIEAINTDTDGVKKRMGDMIEKNPSVLKDFSKNPMLIAEAVTGKPMQPAPVAAAPAPTPASASAPVAAPAPAPAANAQTATPARPSDPVTPPPAAKPAPVAVVQATPQELQIQGKILDAQLELAAVPGFTELMDRAAKDPTLDRALTAMMGEKEQTPEQTLKSLTEFKDKLKAKPEGLTGAVKMYDRAPASIRESFLSTIAENPSLGHDFLAGKDGSTGALISRSIPKLLGLDAPTDKNNPLSGLFSKLFGGKDLSNMFAGLGPMIEKFIGTISGSLTNMAKSPALMNIGGGGLLAGLLTAMSPNDPQVANKPVTDPTTGITRTAAQLASGSPDSGTPAPAALVARNDPRPPNGPGGPGGGPT